MSVAVDLLKVGGYLVYSCGPNVVVGGAGVVVSGGVGLAKKVQLCFTRAKHNHETSKWTVGKHPFPESCKACKLEQDLDTWGDVTHACALSMIPLIGPALAMLGDSAPR